MYYTNNSKIIVIASLALSGAVAAIVGTKAVMKVAKNRKKQKLP